MPFVFAPTPTGMLPIEDEKNLYFPVNRIFGIACNFGNSQETNLSPKIFMKPADAVVSVVGKKAKVLPMPSATQALAYEVELVVAIGKNGKNISEEEAEDYIYGYAVGLDMTRRDLQKIALEQQLPWEAAKAFDQSAPIGAIRPAYRTPRTDQLDVWLYVNNQKVQAGNTREMRMNVAQLVSYISSLWELKAGDLIMTGTPAGSGFVNLGDELEGGVQGVGTIRVSYQS